MPLTTCSLITAWRHALSYFSRGRVIAVERFEKRPAQVYRRLLVLRRAKRRYRELAASGRPDLSVVLQAVPKSFRRFVLCELIPSDLKRSWMTCWPKRLEDYWAEYANAIGEKTPSLKLVLAEYRIRCAFGDGPTWASMCERFPHVTMHDCPWCL